MKSMTPDQLLRQFNYVIVRFYDYAPDKFFIEGTYVSRGRAMEDCDLLNKPMRDMPDRGQYEVVEISHDS